MTNDNVYQSIFDEVCKYLPDDWEKVVELKNKIGNFIAWILPYQSATLLADLASLTASLLSMKGLIPSGGATGWTVALSFAKIAISFAADKIYQEKYSDAYEVFQFLKSEIVCIVASFRNSLMIRCLLPKESAHLPGTSAGTGNDSYAFPREAAA